MACRLIGTKPLSEPIQPYCQLDHEEHIIMKLYLEYKGCYEKNAVENVVDLRNGGHIVSAATC